MIYLTCGLLVIETSLLAHRVFMQSYCRPCAGAYNNGVEERKVRAVGILKGRNFMF